MKHSTYCIICLGTEMKMFQLNLSIYKIYMEIISVHDQLSLKDVHACYECVHLLHKYGKFKAKCRKAYNILCSLSSEPFKVKQENLKSIDRKQSKLKSVLTICTRVNHVTNYYLSNQQEDVHNDDLEQQLNVGMVKNESVLIRIHGQCHKEIFHSQEDLQSPTVDPITFDDDLESQSNVSNDVIKTDVNTAGQPDIENDDYTLDVLEKSSCNNHLNNESFCNKSTKIDSELGTALVINDRNNAVPDMKFKVECVDSNNDSDCVISNKCLINIGSSKIDVSKTKKKRHQSNDRNNIRIKHSKKKKCEHISLPESIKCLHDVEDKYFKKKQTHKTRKTSLKVINKADKDGRFSIDSSIFKEHMTIVQLTSEDAKSELLLRKESRNYKMNSHKCDLCYRGFISQATYKTHMKKHSSEYGSLKCDICQLSFTETRYLTNHRIVCHARKFLCKICPYVCFGANQARAHIRSHNGKKYTCKECREIFRFPNSLSTHMRLRHSAELVCDFCGSTFASPKGLDCHKRILHRKETNEHLGPQCTECDVHFASELAWKRHLVLCSRHEVSNGCGVCGDSLPNARSLRTHLREHGPLPTTWNSRLRKKEPAASTDCSVPQPCTYCAVELRNKKEYKIHMASEHPQVNTSTTPEGFLRTSLMKWVCEVCGKMFKHYSLFISHQRKHTGEKPYSCPECGKRFKRADAVKAHRPLHTNEYTFKCHLCDKAYGDRGKLNRHVKGHLGIRPYKCRYCDKSFLYQCVANAHTKYVHCKEPYPKRDRSKRTVKAKLK